MAPTAVFGQNGRAISINGMSGCSMKRIAGLTFLLSIFLPFPGGYAAAHDVVRVEPAPSGQPYDYVVHVLNTYDIGYNPEVRRDRNRMALRLLRGRCRAPRVVGDDKIITEIWGITSSRPDYIVLVKCT
jgi:hypothetical protein